MTTTTPSQAPAPTASQPAAPQGGAYVENPAEIEHVAGDVSKNRAESNMTGGAYAELADKLESGAVAVGSDGEWVSIRRHVRDEAVQALRASHGQAPAGAAPVNPHWDYLKRYWQMGFDGVSLDACTGDAPIKAWHEGKAARESMTATTAQPAPAVTDADIEAAREHLADVHNATQMRSALGQLRREVVIELAARGLVPSHYGATTTAQPAPAAGNWIAADDVNRLVRELDVCLNGEAGAAAQASLCDVVAQVRHETAKRGQPLLAAPAATPQADNQPEDENDAHNFDICQCFDHWLLEKGAMLTPHSEESDGPMAPALNWIASVEAMVAARAPADNVTAPAAGPSDSEDSDADR